MKDLLKNKKLLSSLLITFFIIACASGNCRENSDMQKKSNPSATENSTLTINKNDVVRIYKYDGSLQCGMGKSVSVDKMKEELKNIKVISGQNKSDGLMHIQQCGTPTGKANVYEILKQDLTEAKKLGFKEWIWD
jgi:hypothetical protein